MDVLIAARNDYRKFLHTADPFPERNTDSLRDVHNILLDAICEFKETGGELDNGSLLLLFIFEVHSQYNRCLQRK